MNIFMQSLSINTVFAAGNVSLDLNLKRAITGTGPFNTSNAGGGFHPGDDYSDSDEYVRTLDTVTYDFSYAVNPGTTDSAINVVITSTISLGDNNKPVAVWDEEFVKIHPGLSVTNEGRTLICNLGNQSASDAYKFSPIARILPNAENGAGFTVSATISADNAEQKTVDASRVIVSALPKLDLVKQTSGTFDGTGPNEEKGKFFIFSIALLVGDGKGSEPIEGPITFTDDLSNFGIPNARLYTFDGNPDVGINGSNNSRKIQYLPYGSTTASNPVEQSVPGSPTITAVQTAPGQNIQFTVNNIETTGSKFPSQNMNGSAVAANQKYVFSGFVALWVDDKDIPEGDTTIINKYTDLYCKGTSGILNYGGKSEPLDNNIVSFNNHKASAGDTGTGTASFGSSIEYRDVPTITQSLSGDGVVYEGQTFTARAYFNNGGTLGLNNYIEMIKIDPSKVKVTDLEGKPGSAMNLTLSNVNLDDLQVQYGTGVYSSWQEQRADTGESSNWYNSTTEALASGTGPINKVRVITKSGKAMPQGSTMVMDLNVTALNSGVGTIAPVFLAAKADGVDNGQWRLGSYDPETHKNSGAGDRVAISEVISRIQMKTEPEGILSSDVDKEITFKLQPTLTTDSRYSNITVAENVVITNTLPSGFTYVQDSATPNQPASVVKNSDGTTTLKWNLQNVNINSTIAPIYYKVLVDFDVRTGSLQNKAVISTPLDGSIEALRTSSLGINIVNNKAWGIRKSVDKPIVEVGDELVYYLKYAKIENDQLYDLRFIDILPYNGDGRSPQSSFNGTYEIKEISGSSGEYFYFTTDLRDSINRDPELNTNNWQPYSEAAVKGKAVTAIKVTRDFFFQANAPTQVVKVKLVPFNNKAGYVYANNFSGRASGINVPVYSSDVAIRVVGSSIGDCVWNDANANGVKDSDEVGIANVTVNLLDQQGNTISSTVTDAAGKYTFSSIHSGDYKVKVDESTLPIGFVPSYDLDRTLDNTTTVSLAANTKYEEANFGYCQKFGNLVVKYLEQGTNKELTPQVTTSGAVRADYTTTAAAIDGYALVSTPSNAAGKYIDGTVEVVYYYTKAIPWIPLQPATKLGNLLVKYLEQGTNNVLAPQVTTSGAIGVDYTTTAAAIDGYSLVSTPSNATGKYVDGTVEVIYYYTKTVPWTPIVPAEKLGNLVVKYLEQGTNKVLAPEVTDKQKVGVDYTTTAAVIDGYDLIAKPTNEQGKYIDGTIEVIYYYVPKKPVSPSGGGSSGGGGGSSPGIREGVLVVKYLDRDTNKELLPNITDRKPVGTEYTTSAKDINGYQLMNIPTNEKGKYIDGTTEVIYYYAQKVVIPDEKVPEGNPEIKEGVLVIKYLDRDTNKELATQITDKKLIGTEYSATAKDIDGYELVAVPSNEKGKYIDGTTEVVYYYAPKKVIVPQDKIAEGAPLLPKTGEGSSIPYYALGTLLLIAGLRINSRKSKKI